MSGANGGGDEASNKPPADTGKPTDDSEGVPGYLVDPDQLSATIKNDRLLISAPKGTAVSDDSGQVLVHVYQLESAGLTSAKAADGGGFDVDAKKIVQGLAEKDGGLALAVDGIADLLIGESLLVSVGRQESAKKALIRDHPKGVTSAFRAGGVDGAFRALSEDEFGDIAADGGDDQEPKKPACEGELVDSFCWYLAPAATSCTDLCKDHGGTDDATISHVGSGGTFANCEKVMRAIGVTGVSGGDDTYELGVGCSAPLGQILRIVAPPTSHTALMPLVQRACACKE